MSLGPLVIPGSATLILCIMLAGMLLTGVLLHFSPRSGPRRPEKRVAIIPAALAQRKVAVVLSVAALGFCLTVLALRPQIRTSAAPGTGLLVTSGATMGQLRTVTDAIGPSPHAFSTIGSQPWQSLLPNLVPVPDIAFIARHYPHIRTLDVLGHGIPAFAQPELGSVRLTFHPAPAVPGLRRIHWPGELRLGQTMEIAGIVHGLGPDGGRLYLSGPGGATDSTEIVGEDQPFSLCARPKDVGRLQYQITATAATQDTLLTETIPIHVRGPELPRVLILESQPRFDTKYLKNWLSRSGVAAALRTRISRDRYRDEFVNRETSDLAPVTRALLDEFDLLIVDPSTITALSTGEQRLLSTSVEDGLGLLILFDPVMTAAPNTDETNPFYRFSFNAAGEIDFLSIRPVLSADPGRPLSLATAAPYDIRPGFGLHPLVRDTLGRIFAAGFRRGMGLIGVTLLSDTFQWLLEKKPDEYHAYWTHLISALARPQTGERWLLPEPQTIFMDQPVTCRLAAAHSEPTASVVSESGLVSAVALAQDTGAGNVWTGTFWPRESGWHRIDSAAGTRNWFYVFTEGEWESARQHRVIAATLLRAQRSDDASGGTAAELRPALREIPRLPFFLVFLLAIAYLWIERKR